MAVFGRYRYAICRRPGPDLAAGVGAFVLVGMFAAQAHAQMGVARGKVVDANGDRLCGGPPA